MAWYLAPSLRALREQADALAPRRSKASDGTIGDAAHASRRSDHNPKPDGRGGQVVDAIDITHDPAGGMDIHACLRSLAGHGDGRVKYLISAGEIWNPPATAWATYRRLRDEGHSRLRAAAEALPGWRAYYGANPHRAHGHVSVRATDAARRDVSSWFAPDPNLAPAHEEDDDVTFRYSINGQVWTTDLVWRQHWESPDALRLVLAHTRELAFESDAELRALHESLETITPTWGKARDAVNYAADAQDRLVALEAKVDQLLARVEDRA